MTREIQLSRTSALSLNRKKEKKSSESLSAEDTEEDPDLR